MSTYRRRECLGVSALVILSTFCSFSLIVPDGARGATLYVGGPGNQTTIQEAIDNASSGDTVFVNGGTYFENIVVNKSIDLIGEDRQNTRIHGPGVSYAVNVTANWVNTSGLMICGGAVSVGLQLWDAHNCTVTGNSFSAGNGPGIYLFNSSGNEIVDNAVTFSEEGMLLEFSDGNTIADNTVSYSGEDGILLSSSWHNSLLANEISSSAKTGILMYESSHNDVVDNNITGNNDGLWLYYSSNNTVVGNIISENSGEGIGIVYPSADNQIHHNVFLRNKISAYGSGDDQWDDGAEGNRWDDYEGEDEDGDGIGDVPYHLPIGGERDRFPLMMPMASLRDAIVVVVGEKVSFGEYDNTYDAGTVAGKSWDFDDSNGIQEDAFGDDPNHTYTFSRTCTATLTVTAKMGYTTMATMSVMIVDEILAAVTDAIQDVKKEDGRPSSHPDIDLTSVNVWRLGANLIVSMSVAGSTVASSPVGEDRFVYSVFFFTDRRDNVEDVDDADSILICTMGEAVIEHQAMGRQRSVDVDGFGTPTLTITVPLWYIGEDADLRINAMAANYIGYDFRTGEWSDAYFDWVVDAPETSPILEAIENFVSIVLIPATLAVLILFGVILLVMYQRDRKADHSLEMRLRRVRYTGPPPEKPEGPLPKLQNEPLSPPRDRTSPPPLR